MSEIQYNLQFEKLCDVLQLGKIVNEPKAIDGGFLHRMYAVETTKGKYAVKALNPRIMVRPVAMQHFIHSEAIVSAAVNRIPALPAKRFKDTFLQEVDKQFYLVFDWVDGRSLKANEINTVHCEKIGTILADMHMTDFSHLNILNNWSDNDQPIDWKYYLEKGQENNSEWVNLLKENLDNIYNWNSEANKAASELSSEMVISHRDLDPKNVMWLKDNPIIIDWESAGYINPNQDLTETAIYWAEDGTENIDKERFLAFLAGYKKKKGTIQVNWKTVLLTGFSGKLGWLEYSLKRSLWIECTDAKEQGLGTDQAIETINAITRYADMISEIEKWLNDEI